MTEVIEPQRRKDAKISEPSWQQNQIARQIVDAAFTVHSEMGPGLLESVYEQCLVHELSTRDLSVARQVSVPLKYRGNQLEAGFRIDLLVAHSVVVEIKAVDKLLPVHDAQLLTYLKLSGFNLGLLINFNVPRIKDGLRRLVFSA